MLIVSLQFTVIEGQELIGLTPYGAHSAAFIRRQNKIQYFAIEMHSSIAKYCNNLQKVTIFIIPYVVNAMYVKAIKRKILQLFASWKSNSLRFNRKVSQLTKAFCKSGTVCTKYTHCIYEIYSVLHKIIPITLVGHSFFFGRIH